MLWRDYLANPSCHLIGVVYQELPAIHRGEYLDMRGREYGLQVLGLRLYRLIYTLLALWPIERMPEVGSWHSSRSSSEAVVRESPVSLT